MHRAALKILLPFILPVLVQSLVNLIPTSLCLLTTSVCLSVAGVGSHFTVAAVNSCVSQPQDSVSRSMIHSQLTLVSDLTRPSDMPVSVSTAWKEH